jgi:hypothetical protein
MFGALIEVTPTVDTSAYGSGDHVGDLQTLSGVNADGGQACFLRTLVVVDKAKQKAALSVLFFDESQTIASSDNGALDITDAEMVDKCIGYVAVAAADYKDLNANSVATVKDVGLMLKPKKDGKLYAIVLSGGTPTYGSASDLCFKYQFEF